MFSFSSGIGTDCSVTPTRHGASHSLIQTTNFVYPIIDDPYSMGKIACAHALSDLYALGVTECDNILMLLGVSQKLSEKERDAVIPLIIKGFKVSARDAFKVKAKYIFSCCSNWRAFCPPSTCLLDLRDERYFFIYSSSIS